MRTSFRFGIVARRKKTRRTNDLSWVLDHLPVLVCSPFACRMYQSFAARSLTRVAPSCWPVRSAPMCGRTRELNWKPLDSESLILFVRNGLCYTRLTCPVRFQAVSQLPGSSPWLQPT